MVAAIVQGSGIAFPTRASRNSPQAAKRAVLSSRAPKSTRRNTRWITEQAEAPVGASRRATCFDWDIQSKPNELPRRLQLLPFSYIGPKACCIRRRAINPITISRHQCQSHFCHIQNCKHLRYHRTPPNSSSRSPYSRLRPHTCCAPCCCLLYLAHSLSSAQTMWHRQCGTCVSLEACCPPRRNNSRHAERVWCGAV